MEQAAFYEGSIADQIVKANIQRGGSITKEDLKHYTVNEEQPLTCQYKGYQIITAPPPGSGATICEALRILDPYPLGNWGFHSSQATHYILEAMRFAYADRNHYLGDPHFVNNPVNRLLSDPYVAQIRHKIKPNKATLENSVGFFPKEGHNTTSYVVVDNKRNAVSVTYTLNDYFGAKVIAKNTGFFLNDEMTDFTFKPGVSKDYGLAQGSQNLIAPDKKPLSSMAPTILSKNHQLFLVLGTPGGATIPSQLISVILNVIDYGMDIQEAEDFERYHMQWQPDLVFLEPFTLSKDTQQALEKMGYHFILGSPFCTPLWGAVTGIMVNPKDHKLYGAIDSRRRDGAAMGN